MITLQKRKLVQLSRPHFLELNMWPTKLLKLAVLSPIESENLPKDWPITWEIKYEKLFCLILFECLTFKAFLDADGEAHNWCYWNPEDKVIVDAQHHRRCKRWSSSLWHCLYWPWKLGQTLGEKLKGTSKVFLNINYKSRYVTWLRFYNYLVVRCESQISPFPFESAYLKIWPWFL